MTADHETRLRAQEMWAGRHETECAGRHRALNQRFDQNDAMAELARSEAAAARAAAEVAVETAMKAAGEAKIGRATILTWLKATVLSVATAAATLLSGSPIVQGLVKHVLGAQ